MHVVVICIALQAMCTPRRVVPPLSSAKLFVNVALPLMLTSDVCA